MAAEEAGRDAARLSRRLMDVTVRGVSTLVRTTANLAEHEAVPFVGTLGVLVREIIEQAEAVGANEESVKEAERRARTISAVVDTLGEAQFPAAHPAYVLILEALAQLNEVVGKWCGKGKWSKYAGLSRTCTTTAQKYQEKFSLQFKLLEQYQAMLTNAVTSESYSELKKGFDRMDDLFVEGRAGTARVTEVVLESEDRLAAMITSIEKRIEAEAAARARAEERARGAAEEARAKGHKFSGTAELSANKELRVGADLWHRDMEAALAKYGHMSDWDVSDITSMRELFENRQHFNEDLSRWNVSRVTDMERMFNGATAFTGAGIGCWDVSSVTTMGCMLKGAKAFNEPIGDWDVSSVTDMSFTLAGATAFNAPIGDWDVSSVTDMSFMLNGATSFNQQLGGQWATSTADKTRMFYRCPGSIEGKTNDVVGTPR